MSTGFAPASTGAASHRATRATVHLDRIASNVRIIRRLAGDSVKVLAVVKANAYGHGAVPVAVTALDQGASWLGVACVDEGLELRNAGISAPILVLGYVAPAELESAAQTRLSVALGTMAQCAVIATAARGLREPLRVHLKIDSGMGRYGITLEQSQEAARELAKTPEVHVEGCFTHFARGEEEPALATDHQIEMFREALGILSRHGLTPDLIHASNSGATLIAPHARFGMVRAGLLLYGYRPERSLAPDLELRPALEVESCLARVQALPAGAGIGYGHTYTLPTPATVGLVPMGYADGLQRSLSGKGYLVAGDSRVPIIGRVSMDQCIVDLSGVDMLAEGDPVVVIGARGGASVWADDLADWAGTIPYEILCGISARVPRTYLAGGTL